MSGEILAEVTSVRIYLCSVLVPLQICFHLFGSQYCFVFSCSSILLFDYRFDAYFLGCSLNDIHHFYVGRVDVRDIR